MKKRTIKRSILSALVVTIMLMAALLTACSSGQVTEIPAKEETTKAEVTEETNEAEQEEVATPEPTEEPTPEPEPEPTPEPVVYEGIDMESTLPGAEWIATFNGVITDPKFVIFNDDTNKKIIVEDGQDVEFSDTDTLAVFIPTDKEVYVNPLEDNYTFKRNSVVGMNARIYYEPTSSLNNGDKVEVKQGLEVDGEEKTLTVTLVIKRS